jgi:quinol monooxygenase YgiN
MLIVHVHAHVKAEAVDAFRNATLENAAASLREPGVVRFDVIQELDDPTRFVLVEVYRDEQAPARHKETPHYAKWRDAVAALMAEPRTSKKYRADFPDESRWETPPGGG